MSSECNSEDNSENTAPKKRSRRGRRSTLSIVMEEQPDVYQAMLVRIRLGAFAHVAASSLGIRPETFSRWLTKGKEARSGIFAQFYQDVSVAQAEARMTAEMEVRRDNPLAWLRYGPGRTRRETIVHENGEREEIVLPGWSDDPKIRIEGGDKPIRVQHEIIRPAPVSHLADALAVLENLGYIQRTPEGMKALGAPEDDSAAFGADGNGEIVEGQVVNPVPEPDDD